MQQNSLSLDLEFWTRAEGEDQQKHLLWTARGKWKLKTLHVSLHDAISRRPHLKIIIYTWIINAHCTWHVPCYKGIAHAKQLANFFLFHTENPGIVSKGIRYFIDMKVASLLKKKKLMTKTEGRQSNHSQRDVFLSKMCHTIIQTSTSIKTECRPPLQNGEVLPKCTCSQKEVKSDPKGNTQLLYANITENRNRQVQF